MANRSALWADLAGTGSVAICCGAPLPTGAIGTLGVATLLAWGTGVIIPAVALVIAAAALGLYLRFRRTHASSECCDDGIALPSRNPR